MIQTSYYSNPLLKGREAECVAISRGLPMYTRKDTYSRRLDLAPTKEIMHIEDEARYRERYFAEILSKLDPAKVAAELDGKILLCFEKPNGEFCHRRMVAEWLHDALGIEVPEAPYLASKPKRAAKPKRDVRTLAATLGMQMVLPA